MAAGLKTLELLEEEGLHTKLAAATEKLALGFKAAADKHNIPLTVNYVGAMFGIFFTEQENISCFEQVTQCDINRFNTFFHLMLEEGVYLAPSAYEAGFLSTAHTDKEIQATLVAADKCFEQLANQ